MLQQNAGQQCRLGADVHLFAKTGLQALLALMQVDDLNGAAGSPSDGLCDPKPFPAGGAHPSNTARHGVRGQPYCRLCVVKRAHRRRDFGSADTLQATFFINVAGA
jgi:hypothetical protein